MTAVAQLNRMPLTAPAMFPAPTSTAARLEMSCSISGRTRSISGKYLHVRGGGQGASTPADVVNVIGRTVYGRVRQVQAAARGKHAQSARNCSVYQRLERAPVGLGEVAAVEKGPSVEH